MESNANVIYEFTLNMIFSGVKLIDCWKKLVRAILTMACSSASTAATGEEEKEEQRLIDAMFLCDEWRSSKGGLSTFNREFAINLAEATAGSMKIHCYVSNSDDRDREDAEQHGVNLITA